MALRIELKDKKFKDFIDRVIRGAEDFDPLSQEIGDRFSTLVDLEFTNSIDPYGKDWAEINYFRAEGAVKGKGERKPGDPPLLDTGELAGSFDTITFTNGLIFGTNTPYASPHQTGTDFIKQRRMLPDDEGGFPQEWIDEVTGATTDYLNGLIRRVD